MRQGLTKMGIRWSYTCVGHHTKRMRILHSCSSEKGPATYLGLASGLLTYDSTSYRPRDDLESKGAQQDHCACAGSCTQPTCTAAAVMLGQLLILRVCNLRSLLSPTPVTRSQQVSVSSVKEVGTLVLIVSSVKSPHAANVSCCS